jgi:hypothetical protein
VFAHELLASKPGAHVVAYVHILRPVGHRDVSKAGESPRLGDTRLRPPPRGAAWMSPSRDVAVTTPRTGHLSESSPVKPRLPAGEAA